MNKKALGITASILMLVTSVIFAATKPNQGVRKPEYWPGEGPAAQRKQSTFAGKVIAVSTSSISIRNKKGLGGFAVTQDTKVKIEGAKASIADVEVGDYAKITFGLDTNQKRYAKAINVPKYCASGKITAIDSDSFTLKNRTQTFTVELLPDTQIKCHGYVGNTDDLRVGYLVKVQGEPNGSSLPANTVSFVVPKIRGVVTEVSGYQLIVKTAMGEIVTVTSSDSTAVLIRPRTSKNYKGSLADVKPGSLVNIGGHRSGDNQLNALWIDVLTTGTSTAQSNTPNRVMKQRK